MITLVIDRSTEIQSAAIIQDGSQIEECVFPDSGTRSARWPDDVRTFLAGRKPGRIVVGTGPGSFGGIRSALAFAQGMMLPQGGNSNCPKGGVFGLPSTMAFTAPGRRITVIGDARRGKYWSISYDGVNLVRDFELTCEDGISKSSPEGFLVATPDGDRIENLLSGIFKDRYSGSSAPLAGRLAQIAAEREDLLIPDPLPIYLQAPVQ